MKEIVITVNGTRYKAKKLDEDFANFVEETLEGSGIDLSGDNSAEALFLAYLRLAGKHHNYEKEIEAILSE